MKLAWKIFASTALALMLSGAITSAAAGNWGCASDRILAFMWCLISILHSSRAENLEGFADFYERQCADLVEDNKKLMSESNSLYHKCCELEDKLSAESEETGEWIDSSDPGSVLAECSLCHYDCGAWSMKFCPNCGHPMKGGANNAENDAD